MLGRPLRGRRMVDIKAAETSGVDHPAHLVEGWAVMKAADGATSATDLVERLKAEGLEVEKMAPAALATMLREAVGALPPNAQGPARALIAALGGTTKEAGMPETDPAGGGAGGTETPTLEAQVATLAAQVADLTKALDTSKAAGEAATKARTEAEAKLLEATKALSGAPANPPTEAEALAKAMESLPEPVRKAWMEDRGRIAKAEKMAADERDARLSAEYLTKARELGGVPAKPEDLATLLREADEKLSKEAGAELGRLLKAVAAQEATSDLFKEAGAAGGGPSYGSAWDKVAQEAQALVKASVATGVNLTFDQAVDKVATTNPQLIAAYQREVSAQAGGGR